MLSLPPGMGGEGMQMRRSWLIGTIAALLGAACGDGNAPLDGAVDAAPTLVPADVETVAPETVRAGEPLSVSCLLVDPSGETFTPPPDVEASLRFVPEASVERTDDGWIATRVGRVEVSCVFRSLRLSDETPAIVEVTPGEPARVVTSLDLDSIEAGGTVRASCEVFDAYGNRIEDASPTVRSEPAEDGNAFEDSLGTFTKAGFFDVFCELPGAESTPAELEVRPGIPASLVISRVPDQPIYAIGQVIDIARLVADRYGNPIDDAVVPVTSDPPGQQLGDGRFRYLEDGRYTLTATVVGPTEGGEPLSASTVVIVDGNGPAIACDDPVDGAILDRRPGGTITFRGSVSDLSGVTDLRVNGTQVTVDANGSFTHELETHYGINFVDLSATDSAGREASRTCAFLVADVWSPDDRTLSDTLSLRMRQAAFDDGDRTDGLDSLGDILSTVINSSGLRDTLHSQLRANNPLKPSSCDSSVLGVCVLRSEVIYRDSELNGPNTSDLQLVDGGLRATVRLENVRIRIRVRGRVSGIPYDTTGWVTFSHLEVRATFDTGLSGGRPRITVRRGSVSTDVGSIDTDFSGLDGGIIDIVVDLFQGRVRDLIANLVRDWVTDNFNDILDGVVGGLDVSSLGTSFEVPRLDSDATIPLTFGLGFSSLNTTSRRMLFGIGTRFFAPAAHARPTLGAPVRRGARLLDPGGDGSTAVAVHEAILNQALHALWRGGFFDATLNTDALGGGLPAGVEAELSTGLPPVVVITAANRVEMSLGAMVMRLSYPDLFAEPINLTLGVRASMRVRLSGDSLIFDGFGIEELYFSTDLASLDMSTRDTLEGFLSQLLERIIRPALMDALPTLPIPSFELPASLATYGLPAGAELGLVRPGLSPEPPHFVLRGDFAVR